MFMFSPGSNSVSSSQRSISSPRSTLSRTTSPATTSRPTPSGTPASTTAPTPAASTDIPPLRLEVTPGFRTKQRNTFRTVHIELPGVLLKDVQLRRVGGSWHMIAQSVSSPGNQQSSASAEVEPPTNFRLEISMDPRDDPERVSISSFSNGVLTIKIMSKIGRSSRPAGVLSWPTLPTRRHPKNRGR